MLEPLLDEIHDRGYRLSNLFQLDSGLWQANLRSATHYTDFGRGHTPEAALSEAIDAIGCAHESLPDPPITTNNPYQRSLEAFRIDDILANLRSRAPNPFTRRL